MATAADSSSTNHHSPGPEFDGGGVNRRTTPWAKVVRGDSESSVSLNHLSPPSPKSVPEQNPSSPSKAAGRSSPSPPPAADVFSAGAAESSDGHNGNAARAKKPAWNKPSKEVLEVGPVMGAVAWPALSESARASPKLPAESSSKTVTDVSVPLPVSPGPVITPSPNSRKYHANPANTNPASNHAMPARQRPTKHGGGSSMGGVNAHAHSGGFAHPPPPPPPPPFPVFTIPNGFGTLVPAIPDPSPRDPSFRRSSWDARPIGFGRQSHQINDHRNSFRRGNFGTHPRVDGPYHNNKYGSKRDHQDRAGMNGRDFQMHQQQRPPPRGLVRPVAPSSASFTPQTARPFANPMGFQEFVYIPTLPLDPIRMPFIPHAQPHPAMFIPVAESPMPSLPSLIVNQIDYYFSDTNLIRDEYLRSNMDAQGWVPISLIANFPRVKSLTTNVQLITDSLRASRIVEVQDDKLRRRNDWTKWISTTGRLASESGTSSSVVQSSDMLSTSSEKMTADDASTGQIPGANSKDISQNFSTLSAGMSQSPTGRSLKTIAEGEIHHVPPKHSSEIQSKKVHS